MTREEILDKLSSLTGTMNIPAHKKTNIAWLHKKLSDRNRSHPNFEETIKVVKYAINNGIR